MTRRRRGALTLLGAALLLSAGCGPDVEDFITAEGTYGDGRALSFNEQMRRYTCDSTKAVAPCIALMGLRDTADATEALRGIRIRYTPSQMSGTTSYTSGLLEPVTFYVVQARQDRFVDLSVDGGEISFTSIATQPGEITAGTFRDMVLRRATNVEEDNTQVILTLAKGSFQYLQL